MTFASNRPRQITRPPDTPAKPQAEPLSYLPYAAFRENAKADAASSGAPFGICVIDLDAFSEVNAHYGSSTADAVLRISAKRIALAVGAASRAGRLGPDVFALMVGGITSDEDARRLAERVLSGFAQPIRVCDQTINVSACIGVSWGTDDIDGVLHEAERALRVAKADSRMSYRVQNFNKAPAKSAAGCNAAEIRDAMASGALRLEFQPIYDARTGLPHSAEALLRWLHPRKTISPTQIIEVAERSGLIIDLGAWVLDSALSLLARNQHVRIAVNASPMEFCNHAYALRVQDLLISHGVSPSRVEIEVTESIVIRGSKAAERSLQQLREIGVQVGLDDFGTGFSSLSYLQRLQFDKIKIDQSFVREFTKGGNARLIKSIIELGHGLGMSVVCEGVETSAQAAALQIMGCDYLQGYALAVPMDEAALRSAYGHRDVGDDTRRRLSGRPTL